MSDDVNQPRAETRPQQPRVAVSRRAWLLVGGLGLVLGAGALAQAVLSPQPTQQDARVSGHLNQALPAEFPGWSVRDLPIGDTEQLKSVSERLLQYDDYAYREYTRGTQRFAVYAAYWRPGKMPTRMVAIHTPDRCWTENGWTCSEQQFNTQLDLGDRTQSHVQARVFSPPNGRGKLHVAFWLLAGGQPFDFGQRLHSVSNPVKWWRDVVEEMAGNRREHLFVRITSDQPIGELRGDPAFEEVLRAIGKIESTAAQG